MPKHFAWMIAVLDSFDGCFNREEGHFVFRELDCLGTILQPLFDSRI